MDMDHCKNLHPILDKNKKFMFFSNNKVAQTSINRRLLKQRVIVYKDNPDKYEKIFCKTIPKLFDTIYKFTIVRNPWDRVVSAFSYLRKKTRLPMDVSSMSFDEFVKQILKEHGAELDAHFECQHPKAFYQDECFVDFIGRMENIAQDWSIISGKISAPSILPHKNRSDHKSYQTYYNAQTKEIVRKIYAQDIDVFQYSFELG